MKSTGTSRGKTPPQHMRKVACVVACGLLVAFGLLLSSCTSKEPEVPTKMPSESSSSATAGSSDASASIAFVNSVSAETAYGQAIVAGINAFIAEQGTSTTASTVLPAADTDEARLAAIDKAIADGANVIVCPGDFGSILYGTAQKQADTSFLLVSGELLDAAGKTATLDNVHSIVFQEEQAGYLAGYGMVIDGNYDIAFAGGREVPAVARYGYGFLQGASAAATEKNVADKVSVTYWYSGSFEATDAAQAEVKSWFDAGTIGVFSCGGNIVTSVLAAAEGTEGIVMGVDVDQAALSNRIVSSAILDLTGQTTATLTKLAKNDFTWPNNLAGKTTTVGAADGAVGLSTATWRFEKWTVADYQALYEKLKAGSVVVSADTASRPQVSIKVNWQNDR